MVAQLINCNANAPNHFLPPQRGVLYPLFAEPGARSSTVAGLPEVGQVPEADVHLDGPAPHLAAAEAGEQVVHVDGLGARRAEDGLHGSAVEAAGPAHPAQHLGVGVAAAVLLFRGEEVGAPEGEIPDGIPVQSGSHVLLLLLLPLLLLLQVAEHLAPAVVRQRDDDLVQVEHGDVPEPVGGRAEEAVVDGQRVLHGTAPPQVMAVQDGLVWRVVASVGSGAN